MEVRIAGKLVGRRRAFFVAEAGINHNGRISLAKKLIYHAMISGADAVKFQAFRAENLTSTKSKFFKAFKKLELRDDELEELADYAKGQAMPIFFSVFDDAMADFTASLRVSAFKIASGDITHLPLIRHVAGLKKPTIISTGMANMREVKDAVKTIEKESNSKIVLLHSISSYPPPKNEINLNAIATLKDAFQYPVGFSDNGPEFISILAAVALGANMIEKHFTLSRNLKGPDHSISMNPAQFQKAVAESRMIEEMLGNGKIICQRSELENLTAARRSITALNDIKINEKISKLHIGVKRPANGILPKYYKRLLGKTARRSIEKDQAVQWDDLADGR